MIPVLLETFFVLAGLLHLYWVAGGSWGIGAVLPEWPGRELPKPGPLVTLAVAASLFAAGALVAVHAGWIPLPLPRIWSARILWAGSAVFALRAVGEFTLVGFFKRVRGTRFAAFDTYLYSPLCVALAFGLGALARS